MISENLISSFVKKIESLVSTKPALGEKYGKIFYGEMVNREIELADISSDERIAHLGCGSFPFTAFELARRGWEVEAVDYDERALKRAKELAGYYGFASRINFIQGLCQEIDYSGFDAIWVSYNVRPARECLIRIFETIGSSGKIICRQPRSWLKYLDNRMEAEDLLSDSYHNGVRIKRLQHNGIEWKSASVKQNVGKKSVMIKICPEKEDKEPGLRCLNLEELLSPGGSRVNFVSDDTFLTHLSMKKEKS